MTAAVTFEQKLAISGGSTVEAGTSILTLAVQWAVKSPSCTCTVVLTDMLSVGGVGGVSGKRNG